MKNVSFDIDQNTQIRIGHRPYSKFLKREREAQSEFFITMQLALCPYLILTEINILSVSVPDGKPVIDFIPNLSNILIATGHEGSGLTLVSH